MEPIRVLSLKTACVQRLEELILSGAWQIGARLPSERDLALELTISRPVLHESLVDLAAKGLVRIEPRRGVFIADYRTSGSTALLSSLLAYSGGSLDPALMQSLVEMRLLLETETARQAARCRTDEHLEQFRQILAQEIAEAGSPNEGSSTTLTALDFSFHLLVAVASCNLVYPLMINSFKAVYTHLTGLFYQHYRRTPVVGEVFALHGQLIDAIARQEEASAAALMGAMLRHGEMYLNKVL